MFVLTVDIFQYQRSINFHLCLFRFSLA
jgi:hypothetical protein